MFHRGPSKKTPTNVHLKGPQKNASPQKDKLKPNILTLDVHQFFLGIFLIIFLVIWVVIQSSFSWRDTIKSLTFLGDLVAANTLEACGTPEWRSMETRIWGYQGHLDPGVKFGSHLWSLWWWTAKMDKTPGRFTYSTFTRFGAHYVEPEAIGAQHWMSFPGSEML